MGAIPPARGPFSLALAVQVEVPRLPLERQAALLDLRWELSQEEVRVSAWGQASKVKVVVEKSGPSLRRNNSVAFNEKNMTTPFLLAHLTTNSYMYIIYLALEPLQ